MDDGTILFGELIDILEKKVIGRSTSYGCGWVRVDDLFSIAEDIKQGNIDKFGNQKENTPN